MNESKLRLAMQNLHAIRGFLPAQELQALACNLQSEEGEHFADLIAQWAHVIATMPKTGETDGQGMDAVAHLHYFVGSADWWITEKDVGSPDDERPGMQLQAFGAADLFGDGHCWELGYISIQEVVENGGELDLYWEPKTLREVEEKHCA